MFSQFVGEGARACSLHKCQHDSDGDEHQGRISGIPLETLAHQEGESELHAAESGQVEQVGQLGSHHRQSPARSKRDLETYRSSSQPLRSRLRQLFPDPKQVDEIEQADPESCSTEGGRS